MGKRRAAFLKEAIILFGFLNGLWLAIGVNPGAELLEVVRGIVERLASGETIAFLFTLLPLALAGVMFYLIWKRGRWLGLLAVALAFLAGLWLLAAPTTASLLLVAGLALGFLATR